MIRTLLTTSALVALLAGSAFAGTMQSDSAVNPRTVGASPEVQTQMDGVPNPTAPDAGAPDLNRSTNRNRSMEPSPQMGAMPDDRDRSPNLNRSTNKNSANDGIETQIDKSEQGLSDGLGDASDGSSEDYYD